MEIFLKIKPNLKPKLLQFTDTLTTMDLVWRKLRRGHDSWERARWNPSFPKPNVQSHDPRRNPGQGLELLSVLQLLPRQRYRAPFCCHSSREVPVVLNRNFTADLRNWVMALLLNAFAISVGLFYSLLAPDIPCVTLSTSEARSSPGPQQLAMLHQPRVVFWLFWLQSETFLQCGFLCVCLPRHKISSHFACLQITSITKKKSVSKWIDGMHQCNTHHCLEILL